MLPLGFGLNRRYEVLYIQYIASIENLYSIVYECTVITAEYEWLYADMKKSPL